MRASFRLGRIMGIDIGIHYSWLIIFALVTWSLAGAYFPQQNPGWGTGVYWGLGFLASVLLFVSVLVHELAHSFVAVRRGIAVKSITLFIFGGAANISREADNPSGELLMAVIGPVMSFVLAGLLGLVLVAFGDLNDYLAGVAGYLAWVNASLGAFNLIPGFPLDGGRVLRALIWGLGASFRRATQIASAVGQGFAYLFIIGGIATAFLVGWLGGLWLAFIGWFLASAASSSYQQTVVRETLGEGTVQEVMTSDFLRVEPGVSLRQALENYILPSSQRTLAVMEGDQLLGLLTLTDVKKVPREEWATVQVREAMTKLSELNTVAPNDDLNVVLQRLQEKDLNQLPVLQGGRLLGMVTRSHLLRYLQIRQELDLGRRAG